MSSVYFGDIKGSHPRKLRDPVYLAQMAMFLVWLGLSGDKTLDWILDQLYEYHGGRLYNGLGMEVVIMDEEVEGEFGVCSRRWINDFKKSANKPSIQRLHVNLVRRAMFIEFAILIYLKRVEQAAS